MIWIKLLNGFVLLLIKLPGTSISGIQVARKKIRNIQKEKVKRFNFINKRNIKKLKIKCVLNSMRSPLF
jgi:hypothetical protein